MGKVPKRFFLAKKFDLVHVATGELIRKKIQENSEKSECIRSIVNAGGFPDDSLILDLVREKLEPVIQKQHSVVFDGFPRTLNQARELDFFLDSKKGKIVKVIVFEVPDQVLIDRIQGRYSCVVCNAVYHKVSRNPHIKGFCDRCNSSQFQYREDDKIDVLKKRLRAYRESTTPLIPYYEEKGILTWVDGVQPVSQVSEKLFSLLKPLDL